MNKVFEKILKKTKEKCKQSYITNHGKDYTEFDICTELSLCFNEVQRIVQEVVEEYNGGWIPCSERLPKYGEVVMCSCTNGGITISCITHRGEKQSKIVRFGQHSVIAWQPLPKPFQKGE